MNGNIATRQGSKTGGLPTALLLASLLVMLVGCGQSSVQQKQSHAISTPPALSWRFVMLPNGAPFAGGNGFAVSPVNGMDAWACMPGSGSHYAVWKTQDAAATWQQVSSVSPVTPLAITGCDVVVDQRNQNALALIFSWGAGADGTLGSVSFYSNDNAQHWRQLPTGFQPKEIATLGQTTYAMLAFAAKGSTTLSQSGFVVSHDNLSTWQQVNPASLTPHEAVSQFWVGASPADLLLSVSNSTGTGSSLLFHSTDAGQNWTSLPDARVWQSSLADWSEKSDGWFICTMSVVATGFVECSIDLGQTWTMRPMLVNTGVCSSCIKGTQTPSPETSPCLPDALADDSSLLASCVDAYSQGEPSTFSLQRLQMGASQWTQLGLAPSAVAVTSTGQVWCVTDAGTIAVLGRLP